MRLHHLGYVGRRIDLLERRFLAEGAVPIAPAIDDPIQRVTVRFFREPGSGELWELVAPFGDLAASPLASRIGRGGGIDHLAYELDPVDGDLEAAVARERARGARVICEPVYAVALARRIAFVFRRSGRIVELIEPRPPGAPI